MKQTHRILPLWSFIAAIPIACVYLLLTTTALWAQEDEPPSSLPFRCVGVAPLDPEFCGCTWGSVYYRGRPVLGTEVSIAFQEATTNTVTSARTGSEIVYHLSGSVLGAKRNDLMTLRATFAGSTVERRVRARPNSDGEQNVDLVIPEQGTWAPWLEEGYTKALAMRGTGATATLWAGGAAGLITINLTTDARTIQTLPWPTQATNALAVAADGTVWALNGDHLARRDPNTGIWQNVTPPFTEPMRALVIDQSSGDLWVGGGNTSGALARYKGSWQPVAGIDDYVRTLTIDGNGDLWVGTWGSGVYQHRAGSNLDTLTQYVVDDGLASNYIYSAAVNEEAVWFGTRPVLSGSGGQGGVAFYDLTSNQWHRQTTINGLPADTLLPSATAAITALATDANGTLWAGVGDHIYLLGAPGIWVADGDLADGTVTAVVSAGDQVFAGGGTTLHRLRRSDTPGAAPTVTVDTPSNATLSALQNLVLTATAQDNDEAAATENEPQIINWEWRSDRDGPLCTSAGQCTLTTEVLRLGNHTISVRVQDDEGVWSAAASQTVTVTEVTTVFLPTVQKISSPVSQ